MKSSLKRLRKKQDDSGDDWAVSFADMMTLLLCFFILMVSISAVDIEQYEAVAESLGIAMDSKKANVDKLPIESQARQQITQPAPIRTESDQPTLDELMQDIESRLADAGSAVQIERRGKSLAVRLSGPVFFELGSAKLTQGSADFLRRIAWELQPTDYRLTVEGHTDDLPISTLQFPSNWELSSARAASVARFLIANRIASSRLEVRGLAHTRPLVPNRDPSGKDIPENRVLNRRVVIVVTPKGIIPDS